MSRWKDQGYLLSDQYRNADNLDARIRLHQQFSSNKDGFHQWLFERLELNQGAYIMDVGCGPGDLWLENLDRLPEMAQIMLFDFSRGMIAEASRRLDRLRGQFRFGGCDAQAVPLSDNTLDVVLANFMLYHVPERSRALCEFHRVLKPGGRLYTATNGHAHLKEIRDLVAEIDPEANLESAAMEFGLENGCDQLQVYFADVQLHRYEDDLQVTEVQPLVDYILSSKRSEVVGEQPGRLAEMIAKRIEAEGVFRIRKDVGLFEAIRPG